MFARVLALIFLCHGAMMFLGNVFVVVVFITTYLCMCGVWPFDVVETSLKIKQEDLSTVKSTFENAIDMVLTWICMEQY